MARAELQRRRGWLLLVMALFWNGVLLGVDSMLALQLLQERRARREWIPVEALVVSSAVERHRSSDGTTFKPTVTFQYRFEGLEYTSDRYAFGAMSASDADHARGVVRRHPEGEVITARVDPADPEEAVVDVSGASFPAFVAVFLTPFHCIGVLLLGRALRALTARRPRRSDRRYRELVAVDRRDRLVLRKPRLAPWEVSLVAFGGLAFLSIFPISLTFGIMGAGAWTMPLLASCALGAAAVTHWSRGRDRDPARYLNVDRRLGTFAFPADQEGIPIGQVESLRLSSPDTDVAVNGVPQFDHALTARVGERWVPVFRFRGAREEGAAVRDALAAEFRLMS
ncbi:DUF3592 domain-containing protein [Planctomycetota bacterium]|nr:DUF3592 domain-containing protein [Planctomycetota bacterium]